MLQGNWDLALGWVQTPGVGEVEVACCRNAEMEALVAVGGGSDVEPIGCMWRPESARSWILLYQGFGYHWGRGCLVEIKTTVDFLVG
jgi:hypothetical protein